WIPATLDGRGFSLLNVAATRVLDVNGAGTADGTSVGLWTSNNGANQAWTLAPTAVQSVPDVTVTTAVGVAPVLPATVLIRYVGGGTRTAAVAW
ncbi:RICIN domain-containing protein, partial [Pandoraea pneumonica]|uniref:RICIN domain-containing protein n=1 Tax=Pandoraea pneumonica TaxID=2508299 RepID=UPI003CF0DFDF